MKIGFDVSQTGRLKAGCGYFADGLIRQLTELDRGNDYILYPAVGDLFWDPDCAMATYPATGRNVRRSLAPSNFEKSKAIWRSPSAELEDKLGSPHVFHSNNFFCPDLKTARLVYTLYDLGFVEEPDWTTEENRAGCFRGVFDASLRADRIIAISAYSRDHFLRTFPHYPASRITVVYPGTRFENRSEKPRPPRLSRIEPGRFWLSVATIEPRKNHTRLIEACLKVRAEAGTASLPLVLAGGRGWLMGEFEKTLAGLGPDGDVILTGYLDDSELQWLYENCYAFVYPSLFEGFGLPVLEAMSLGAPVIASKTSSLPEIVGSAGILVDPRNAAEIAAAMSRLAADRSHRDALRSLGAAQARQFSWRSAATKVMDLYQSLTVSDVGLAESS